MKGASIVQRALGGAALVALGAFAFAPVSCGPARSHIFIGRVYDPVHECVSPSEGIDVSDGPGPNGAACPPVCLVYMGSLAISGMCPPYPGAETIEGIDGGSLDPMCAMALTIYNCNITCDADAGPDGGAPETDAAGCLATGGDGGVADGGKPDAGTSPDAGATDSGALEAGRSDASVDAPQD